MFIKGNSPICGGNKDNKTPMRSGRTMVFDSWAKAVAYVGDNDSLEIIEKYKTYTVKQK